jgi:hypothetical protein
VRIALCKIDTLIYLYVALSSMQVISPYAKARIILSIVTAVLIVAAIVMELLPEDVAKTFVIPALISALMSALIQLSILRRN